MKRLVTALVLVLSLVAARPAPSVSVVESDLHYGDRFTAATDATRLTDEGYFHAVCYPVASTVYVQTRADGSIWGQFFAASPADSPAQFFQLIDPVAENWTAGGASCVLTLEKLHRSTTTVLASTTFAVSP